MADKASIDEFIQEIKKLAYDLPPPNPYPAMLLSHRGEAERHRLNEKYNVEDARFAALCAPLASLVLKAESAGKCS
jgi:hypothetical protein